MEMAAVSAQKGERADRLYEQPPGRNKRGQPTGEPRSLVFVAQGQADRDPVEWLPPNQAAHCWYAAAWIYTKSAWELALDTQEKTALEQIIAGCDNFTALQLPNSLNQPPETQPTGTPATPAATAAPQAPTPTATTPKPSSPTCHSAYEPCLRITGDLNCGDLTSSQKPVRVLTPGVDPYRLDRDNNGWGCES